MEAALWVTEPLENSTTKCGTSHPQSLKRFRKNWASRWKKQFFWEDTSQSPPGFPRKLMEEAYYSLNLECSSKTPCKRSDPQPKILLGSGGTLQRRALWGSAVHTFNPCTVEVWDSQDQHEQHNRNLFRNAKGWGYSSVWENWLQSPAWDRDTEREVERRSRRSTETDKERQRLIHHWSCPKKGSAGSQSLLLSFPIGWVIFLCPHCLHDALPHHRPRSTRANWLWAKPPNCKPK